EQNGVEVVGGAGRAQDSASGATVAHARLNVTCQLGVASQRRHGGRYHNGAIGVGQIQHQRAVDDRTRFMGQFSLVGKGGLSGGETQDAVEGQCGSASAGYDLRAIVGEVHLQQGSCRVVVAVEMP